MFEWIFIAVLAGALMVAIGLYLLCRQEVQVLREALRDDMFQTLALKNTPDLFERGIPIEPASPHFWDGED